MYKVLIAFDFFVNINIIGNVLLILSIINYYSQTSIRIPTSGIANSELLKRLSSYTVVFQYESNNRRMSKVVFFTLLEY